MLELHREVLNVFSRIGVCVFMKDISLKPVFQKEFSAKVSDIWMIWRVPVHEEDFRFCTACIACVH